MESHASSETGEAERPSAEPAVAGSGSPPATLPALDATRTLYLDLVERVVTNTIYGDPCGAPWGRRRFEAGNREQGLDWPSVAHSMIGERRIRSLRDLCERAIREHVPGDFIETGVWRGGACILMRAVLAAYGETGRQVWCADSFAGLPPPEAERFPADAGDTLYTYPELAVPLERVRANFAAYGLLDDQVRFVEGYFETTLPGLAGERFALLRLDGDMYASTICALENLYDGVSDGGFVVVDDYGAIEACREAVEDFRRARGIDEPLNPIDWTGVWWRKRAARPS